MFKNQMKKCVKGELLINDVDADVIERLLEYIYSGHVTGLKNVVDRLLVAADKYDLRELKNICQRRMLAGVCVEDAAGYLVLAERHQADELKYGIVRLLRETHHLAAAVETAKWKWLPDHPACRLPVARKRVCPTH